MRIFLGGLVTLHATLGQFQLLWAYGIVMLHLDNVG